MQLEHKKSNTTVIRNKEERKEGEVYRIQLSTMASNEQFEDETSPGSDPPSSPCSSSPADGPCARALSPGFTAKSGAQLFEGIYLGRQLGAGVQAKVFELVYEDGSPVGKVIKLGHQNLNASFLNQFAGSMMDLEREWALGMQLKAALEEKNGTMPGFTKTCDCLVMIDDGGRDKRASFSGMIMERLTGWTINKRIMDPAFHNIHYVREMLFQVFSALDRAQRAVGFHHADLGLRNVMECYPKLFPDIAEDEKHENAAIIASYQNGKVEGQEVCINPSGLLPGRSSTWRRSVSGPGCSSPPPIAGFSVDSDGKLAPLGPHIEFKLIDYGVGEFNETLAQAAGGHEPEETLRRIHSVFSLRGIPIGPNAAQARESLQRRESSTSETIDFYAGGESVGTGPTPSKKWKLWKMGNENRVSL